MASATTCAYEKRSGTTGIAGQFYEVKMCCLMYMRGIRYGKFHMATNLNGAGAFDDLILQLHSDDGPSRTFLIQLKHRVGACISRHKLMSHSSKSKFGLLKYFLSYRDEIMPEFQERGNHQVFGASLEDTTLVFYTNANVTGMPEMSDQESDLLSSGFQGGVYCFREDRDKDVWGLAQNVEGLGDISEYGMFLQRLKVYTRQATEAELDVIIKDELCDTLNITPRHSEVIFPKLLGKFREWWSGSKSVYLTDCSVLWDEMMVEVLQVVNEPVNRHLGQLRVSFSADAVARLRDGVDQARVLLCLAEGDSTTLSLCKVVQVLDQERRRFSLGSSEEALRLWHGCWCHLLVFDCLDVTPDLWPTLASVLRQHPEKRLIVVARADDLQTAIAVRHFVPDRYFEINDVNPLTSLDRQTQQRVMNMKVNFQGYTVALGDLIHTQLGGNAAAHALPESLEIVSNYVNSVHCKLESIKTVKPESLLQLIKKVVERRHNLDNELNLDCLTELHTSIVQLKAYVEQVNLTLDILKTILQTDSLIDKLKDVHKIIEKWRHNSVYADSLSTLLNDVVMRRDWFQLDEYVNQESKSKTLVELIKYEKELERKLENIIHYPKELRDPLQALRTEIRRDITSLDMISNRKELQEIHNDLFIRLNDGSLNRDVMQQLLEVEESFHKLLETLDDEAVRTNALLCEQKVKEAFTADLLYSLLKGESMRLGASLEEQVSYYIPRTLLREAPMRADSAWDLPERVTVIVAEPGMGKSTLLTHVALQTKAKQPDMWVIKANLSSMSSFLLSIQSTNLTQNHATQFLTSAAGLVRTFDRVLMEHNVNITGRIVVFLDGYDEVCPYYKDVSIGVIKIMLSTIIPKVWISSRLYWRKELEICTASVAYSIEAFSHDDQRNFLHKVWGQRVPGVDQAYLTSYIDDVLRLVSESLRDAEKSFMGVPLQTLLVAEVYDSGLKDGSNASMSTPRHLDVTQLYEQFFQKKCEVYFQEKEGFEMSKPSVIRKYDKKLKKIKESHKIAALFSFFSREEHLMLLDGHNITEKAKEFVSEYEEKWAMIGIVTLIEDGKPRFLHRTVAEFLVAKWLFTHINSNQDICKYILYKKEYSVVSMFLDRMLTKGSKVHSAVLNGDIQTLEMCINTTTVKSSDKGGRTPLHLAAISEYHDMRVLYLLQQHGADACVLDQVLQLTPIQYADRTNNWRAVDTMLHSAGETTQLNVASQNSIDVLKTSCEYGYVQLLRYLLQHGATAATAVDDDNTTPLHVASQCNQVQVAQYLLNATRKDVPDSEFNVDATDVNKRTALHYAAKGGHVDIVTLLVQAGCDVDLRDADTFSPVHHAAWAGHVGVVRLLAEAGCNVDASANHAMTPLHYAAWFGRADAVEALVEARCDVNACDTLNLTALHYALERRRPDIVMVLVEAGCILNARDEEKTLLHYMAWFGHLPAARLLVEAGHDVDARDARGKTPLHYAAEHGRRDVVAFLIESKCNTETRDTDNKTPIRYASDENHFGVVKLLFEAQCNVEKTS